MSFFRDFANKVSTSDKSNEGRNCHFEITAAGIGSSDHGTDTAFSFMYKRKFDKVFSSLQLKISE